jgi:hypothetical protein
MIRSGIPWEREWRDVRAPASGYITKMRLLLSIVVGIGGTAGCFVGAEQFLRAVTSAFTVGAVVAAFGFVAAFSCILVSVRLTRRDSVAIRFSIRDLLWLTAVVAVLAAWWIDYRCMAARLKTSEKDTRSLRQIDLAR